MRPAESLWRVYPGVPVPVLDRLPYQSRGIESGHLKFVEGETLRTKKPTPELPEVGFEELTRR